MPAESGVCWVAAERAPLPPMPFAKTFHWDGLGPVSRDGGPMMSSQHPSLAGTAPLH
jgi:hypothetical protein